MVKRLLLLIVFAFAVAMAVPRSRQQIQDNVFTPIRDDIGTRLVPRRLRAMADQLDVRLGRGERLPEQGAFEVWLRRDFSGPEIDPWGNPWFLSGGRAAYTVGSLGPDGQLGTDDDITERRDLPQRR